MFARCSFKWFAAVPVALASMFGAFGARAADENRPHLQKRGGATQLIVEGKPFLILGGAVGEADLHAPQAAWTRLKASNVNTALVPVAWNTIERKEGQFDFGGLDALIKGAQANKLHVVIQWCGSWSDSAPASVPAWVKSDTKALDDDSAAADAKAFAALAKHIGQADANHTVIAAQVEGKLAVHENAVRGQPVSKVVGYVGKVAAAGKAVCSLPLYVECAIDQPDVAAGLIESCHASAPAIDIIAPDVHSAKFSLFAAKFARPDNTLFIAEANANPAGAASLLYAFGKFNAIGVGRTTVDPAVNAADVTTPAFYKVVAGIAPALLDNQGKNTLYAFMFGPGSPDEAKTEDAVTIGPFRLAINATGAAAAGRGGRNGAGGRGFGGRGGGNGVNIGASTTVSGIIIALKPNEYLCLHSGLGISPAPLDPSLGAFALGFQETGNYVDGRWRTYSRTNGDENDHDRRNTGAFNSRWTNLHVAFYQRP
jgi:hypothetical protein